MREAATLVSISAVDRPTIARMASAWQRIADQHHSVLTAQAAHVVAAARSFRAMDEGGAAELEQVGDLADGVS